MYLVLALVLNSDAIPEELRLYLRKNDSLLIKIVLLANVELRNGRSINSQQFQRKIWRLTIVFNGDSDTKVGNFDYRQVSRAMQKF